MKDYVSTTLRITPWSQDIADFAAALLGDIGYESFTTEEPILTAYILQDQFDDDALTALLADFPAPGVTLQADNTIVEGQDWNHEWEKHYFQPIVVGDQVVVRSSFHTDVPDARYQIIVDPRMAFGTGHHSTTRLMMEYLLTHDMTGLTVTDMGTGTGILAILACMLGATDVHGIEIDPDAYANACDNARLNAVTPHLICGDASRLPHIPQADLLLANINRNIITTDIAAYAGALKPGGRFVCSGFYLPDLDIIRQAARKQGLRHLGYAEDGSWVRAEFSAS